MNQINSALGDPLGLDIDVSDLEGEWSSESSGSGLHCAACKRAIPEGEALLLWRNRGDEMIALHWECGQLRMLSVSERN